MTHELKSFPGVLKNLLNRSSSCHVAPAAGLDSIRTLLIMEVLQEYAQRNGALDSQGFVFVPSSAPQKLEVLMTFRYHDQSRRVGSRPGYAET